MKSEEQFRDISAEIDERIAEPGTDLAIKQIRASMREADRFYAMSLASLRKAFDLTQQEIAQRLGVNQSAVAKIEGRRDMLVSTLRSYIGSIGGDISFVVRFHDGGVVEISLDKIEDESESDLREVR